MKTKTMMFVFAMAIGFVLYAASGVLAAGMNEPMGTTPEMTTIGGAAAYYHYEPGFFSWPRTVGAKSLSRHYGQRPAWTEEGNVATAGQIVTPPESIAQAEYYGYNLNFFAWPMNAGAEGLSRHYGQRPAWTDEGSVKTSVGVGSQPESIAQAEYYGYEHNFFSWPTP